MPRSSWIHVVRARCSERELTALLNESRRYLPVCLVRHQKSGFIALLRLGSTATILLANSPHSDPSVVRCADRVCVAASSYSQKWIVEYSLAP